MNVSNESNRYIIDERAESMKIKVPPLEGLSDSFYPSEQHFPDHYPKNVQNNNQFYNNQQYIQVDLFITSLSNFNNDFHCLIIFRVKIRLFIHLKMITIYQITKLPEF